MICRQCLRDLDITEFYIMNGRPSGRCKECTRKDRQMTKLYHEHVLTPHEAWPEALRRFAQEMSDLAAQGAKIDYAQSAIPSIIARVNGEPVDTEANSLEAVLELIASLNARVDDLEAKLSTDWLPEAPSSEAVEAEHGVDEAQRRSNLLKALYRDAYLEEMLGPEEHAMVVDALAECLQSFRSLGIIPGTVLRRLCGPFQEYQCRMPPDMLVFYESFLKPGLKATQASEDYQQHVDSVEALLGLNFYELDWTGIPYIE